MGTYEVTVSTVGYEVYEVEADSEQEATQTWFNGEMVHSEVVHSEVVHSDGVSSVSAVFS